MQQAKPQIASKNLTLLEDQMKHEALACRKASLFAQYFTDPQLQNMSTQIAAHHRMQFDRMFQYLNSHN